MTDEKRRKESTRKSEDSAEEPTLPKADQRRGKKSFQWERETLETRRRALEGFASGLQAYLSQEKLRVGSLREPVIEHVGKELEACDRTIEVRQFELLFKHACEQGYVRFAYHRLGELEQRLRDDKKLQPREGIGVVAGGDEGRFAQAAAEEFIKTIFDVSRRSAPSKTRESARPELNIGIMSGNTTRSVVRCAIELNWREAFGLDARQLPKVRVLALNVCLTAPAQIAGNATILAYQFADKIREESHQQADAAEAYGLSAPLLVEKHALKETDEAPQTWEVLQFTQPYRVREKVSGDFEGDSTKLDIVLTGVGEVPRTFGPEGGSRKPKGGMQPRVSFLYGLASQFGVNMDELVEKERIVGDIAYTPIRSDGTPVKLYRTRILDRDATGTQSAKVGPRNRVECVFYSAIELPVLDAMARDPDKSVILVARHTAEKNKVPAIFASIAGGKYTYGSKLIIDQETAEGLLHY